MLPFAALNVQIPERVGRSMRPEVVAPLCIPGDLYQPPAEPSRRRRGGRHRFRQAGLDRWPVETRQEPVETLDGPLEFHRRRSRFRLRAADPFQFSSPSTSAVAEAAADSADQQFIEGPFAERTWHDRRAALYLYSGLVGIVQRLKTIGFRAIGSFSRLAARCSPGRFLTTRPRSPALPPSRRASTATATSRVSSPACWSMSARPPITSASCFCRSATRLYIKAYTPYGWLPSIKEPKANGYTGVSPIYYANDLAKINLIGQAYHGLGITAGYEITVDGLLNASAIRCRRRMGIKAGQPATRAIPRSPLAVPGSLRPETAGHPRRFHRGRQQVLQRHRVVRRPALRLLDHRQPAVAHRSAPVGAHR